MNFSDEQLRDIRAAITYYMQREISIKNPRYNEYEVILQMLTKSIKKYQWLLQPMSEANKTSLLKNHKYA